MLCILTIFLKHLLNEWCVCLNHAISRYISFEKHWFLSLRSERSYAHWLAIGAPLADHLELIERALACLKFDGVALTQEPITRWLGILSSMHRCQTPPEKRKRERIRPGELSSFLRFHNSQAIERPSSFQYWLRAWEGSIDSYWLKSALWAIDMLGKSSLESYSLLIIEGRFLFQWYCDNLWLFL